MDTITVNEFRDILKAQNKPKHQVEFVCPSCKTVQCAQDLLDSGVSEDDVNRYIGFSCVGRFSNSKGCDWTLGGFLQIHELEITTDDGARYPYFMPANYDEFYSGRNSMLDKEDSAD